MFGRFSAAWLTFLIALAALAGLVVFLSFDVTTWFSARPKPPKLVVACAAGLRKPVEQAAREYQKEFGVEVNLTYGGSDTLLNQIDISKRADLYIPADDSYVLLGRERGILDESIQLGSMRAVLAVKKGNLQGISSFENVIKRQLRVAHANPEAAAIGKLTRDHLMARESWEAYAGCIAVSKPTVNDVGNDIALGAVDAGFVWDATVRQTPGLEVAEEVDVTATFAACVVRSSRQPTESLRFARYLAATDRGGPMFEEHGFTPSRGDAWQHTPKLLLYAGAMLKPAIEKTLVAFQEREGVEVTTVYNGCGILVAQMKAQEKPDIFFACDTEFMTQVQTLFGQPTTVSGNQLVILVQKGNPHGVRKLMDLGKAGLRVGIGHEKQCAMGVLTQQTLKEDKSSIMVMKNVKVQSPTGDMLVNQMRTGSLDAAIAYISNAAGAADELEAVAIDIPCAFAEQPFAIAKTSANKQTCGRLLSAVLARESRERFAAYGFAWKAEQQKK